MKQNVNNYLHKFSKGITAEGQLYLRQAGVKSGHNVDYVTVRGEDIPVCNNREALLTSSHNVILQYANVLKYWYHADLTEYPNSNGLSYYLLNNNLIVSDFIDPSDKLVDGRSLSRGYFALVYGVKENTDQVLLISPIYYNFESYSGILYFNKGKTPKDLGYTSIKLDAFQYIGKNVKQNFKNVELLIAMNLMLMQKLSALRIVIQPYKFSTLNMTAIGDPYQLPGVFNKFGKQIWCQTFKIIIPGYVFETSAISYYSKNNPNEKINLLENDVLGVIIPDIKHITDEDANDPENPQYQGYSGCTEISVLLLVDAGLDIDSIGTGQIIIGYSKHIENNITELKLTVGLIVFIASTFKRNDNRLIDIKDTIVMHNQGSELSAITPDFKKKLLVDKYVVDFNAYPALKENTLYVNQNISSLIENIQ